MKGDELLNGYKYEEVFRGTKSEFKEYFRKLAPKLFANKLYIDDVKVDIPTDKVLNCKIKYEIKDHYTVDIKISWKNEEEDFLSVVEENEF